jgi:hypothetical protein
MYSYRKEVEFVRNKNTCGNNEKMTYKFICYATADGGLTGSPSSVMSSNLDQINCSQPVAAILNSITDTSGCTTSN